MKDLVEYPTFEMALLRIQQISVFFARPNTRTNELDE